MRTSAAALELDFTEPSITAAKAVADTLARNGSLQRDTLLWVMEQAYGGSSADGRFATLTTCSNSPRSCIWPKPTFPPRRTIVLLR